MKIHYKWPFSIAMLVHQRVTDHISPVQQSYERPVALPAQTSELESPATAKNGAMVLAASRVMRIANSICLGHEKRHQKQIIFTQPGYD